LTLKLEYFHDGDDVMISLIFKLYPHARLKPQERPRCN
jgi:glutathionylspermidine synthase